VLSYNWVNDKQTIERRRAKYALARKKGLPASVAHRIRDFRETKFIEYIRNYKKVIKEVYNA